MVVKFSIVVPIVPKHHRHVPSLLRNLGASIYQIYEIIFAASSQTESSLIDLNNKILKVGLEIPIRIENTHEIRTAGENRNIGWKIAEGDFIAFCDADDSYSKKRLGFIADSIIRDSSELLIHDFFWFKPSWFMNLFSPIELPNTINSKTLKDFTFGFQKRIRKNETGIAGNTNVILPLNGYKKNRIQHGHVTVKSSCSFRYGSLKSGEDGQFIRDALEADYKVTYIPLKLSNYNRPTIRNISRSTFLFLIAFLARSKSKILNSL